ncbi:sensor histidine kinase [uncultured Xylophilus sp.]|uniref:sensor histidine kinase n=1 Tax=uncultured Xylophilus sp. TaxID=296832 RepID=UPI0025D3CEE0|nr:sensor histidine kinase [uncultured Xylophilus sp.]
MHHVLWPLAVAWLIGVVVSIAVAVNFTQRAFDRALLDDAYSVAGSVRSTGDSIDLALSPREVGAVLFDQSERIYFAVLWPDGTLLAGHAGLHAPSPEGAASYRFSDITYQGRRLRAVTLRRGAPLEYEVVMAETTRSREALLRTLLVYVIGPQIGLLLLLGIWLFRAISRDVQPLVALEHAMETRDARDLTPVPANASTREIQRLAVAVNGLFARVSAGVRAQREFAGNVAHELRTPLAGIRALAEYGLAQKDPAAWREQLQRIAQSEERASHLVDQLLAMARADEAGVMQMRTVLLDEVARDAVLRFLPRADAARVDLGARGLDEPVAVRAHPALVEGIVNNLIDNALRYGGATDGSRSTITVALSVQAEAGTARLTVVDNGPGIGAAQRDHLQQRWARGPEGAWLKQGTGLGLAIIGRYAALMDAPFTLADGPEGRGLAASVLLPLAATDGADGPAAPPTRVL